MRLVFLVLTSLTTFLGWTAVPAPYEIGTWRGFRPAAISYTFDDCCSNQFAVAVPMFNAKAFKLTLFAPISTMFPGWPKLQSAAANGHEIASHTMTHVNLGQLTDAQQISELQNSRDAINAHVTNQQCLTLAYPFCAPAKTSLTAEFYLAARICSGQLVPSTPPDFMNISCFICGSQGSVQTAQDFNSRAASAAAAKGWCVYLIHGIDNDGGYSPVTTAALQGGLTFLSTNASLYWVETFGNVVRYIRERNAASLVETAIADDRITFRLTDSLDNSVFNYPLTVRRLLPTNWPAATVTQNGQPVAAQLVTVSSNKFLQFDVVPDGGDIAIAQAGLQSRLGHPLLASPTNLTFRLDGLAGGRYAICCSGDLVNWSPIQTTTLVGTSTSISVPVSTESQFYRAQGLP